MGPAGWGQLLPGVLGVRRGRGQLCPTCRSLKSLCPGRQPLACRAGCAFPAGVRVLLAFNGTEAVHAFPQAAVIWSNPLQPVCPPAR